MNDDMGFDLKLPAVGELTLPQWQDWLVHYNAVLGERERRIEKLEAALDDMAQYVSRADWHYLKDETRKTLEGKDE
jgi:hypothetical protein